MHSLQFFVLHSHYLSCASWLWQIYYTQTDDDWWYNISLLFLQMSSVDAAIDRRILESRLAGRMGFHVWEVLVSGVLEWCVIPTLFCQLRYDKTLLEVWWTRYHVYLSAELLGLASNCLGLKGQQSFVSQELQGLSFDCTTSLLLVLLGTNFLYKWLEDSLGLKNLVVQWCSNRCLTEELSHRRARHLVVK